MSRHWKPEIVSPDWTRASAYRRSGWQAVVLVLAGAVGVGFGAAFLLTPRADDSNGKPDAPIEWNAVQAVPTRALSPDEIAWEKRAQDPAVIASPEGARQSTVAQPAEEEAGLPRGSAARNDGAGAAPASYTRLYVIDGDTFALGRQRIRILGIDAPETHPSRCAREAELGNAATERLRSLLTSGTLTISGTGHDQYGRELRTVRVDGQDVAAAMIAAGLARSYDGGKRGSWCS